MYDYILAIDPSGNFSEGKGTTGCALYSIENKYFEQLYTIQAKDYPCEAAYWQKIVDTIIKTHTVFPNLCVVVEDFVLYGHKANAQINSRMETPQLIGVLKYNAEHYDIPLFMQLAAQVKNRWTDEILEWKKIIHKHNKRWCLFGCTTPICEHERDAIRHAIHFATFKNKEGSHDTKRT